MLPLSASRAESTAPVLLILVGETSQTRHGPHPRGPAVPTTPIGDTVDISPEGLAALQLEELVSHEDDGQTLATSLAELVAPEEDAEEGAATARSAAGGPLTKEEQAQVRELKQRDLEVRAHEQAHKAAGGDLAGSPHFEYERGPDGVSYAVGGEVGISLRAGRTPEETASNARRVRQAALAPAQPSAQDQAVAAEAAQLEAQARAQAQSEGEEAQP